MRPRKVSDRREACLSDFWTFCTEALGMPLHEKPHREMCEFLADGLMQNKLLLVPRDCWKTSIGSTALPLWMVLRAFYIDGNPAYRALIDSSTTRLSKFVLDHIKQNIRYKESFKEVFGDLYDKKGDRQEGLSLKFRVEAAVGIREPNFVASGVNSAKTGLHFELMLHDDLVTKENVRTPEQREKVWEHYRMMQAILESDSAGQQTMVAIIGTRYHDADIYGRILKQEAEAVADGKQPIYSTMIRSAVDENDELFFPGEEGKPGGLNLAVLSDKRRKMGGLFWAQFYNDPNKEDAPFKKDQLIWTREEDFPALHRVRLTFDPAVKSEEVSRGDYCAMTVAGWDRWNKPWVLDVSLKDNLTPGLFVDEMLRLGFRWEVEQCLIEDDHMNAMEIVWRAEMRRRRRSFPVILINKTKQQGKLNRWLEIQPYAERGGIHISENIPASMKPEIEDQWCRAPFAAHDDWMDSMALQTLYLPVEVEEEALKTPVFTTVSGAIEMRTPAEILAPRQNESGSPFFGTLADRFPDVGPLRGEDSFLAHSALDQSYYDMERFA